MQIPEGAHPKARIIKCPVSGREMLYPGFGRPPRVHPDVRKARAAQRRRERYAEKTKDKPKKKRGRPSKAEVAARAQDLAA